MAAAKVTNQIDDKASWKYITGRMPEDALTELARKPRYFKVPDRGLAAW
jgi:hypothetical protein